MENKGRMQNQDPVGKDVNYVFHLYITGASPNSSRAITNIKNVFERLIKNNYHLEIIDVYQQPHIAQSVDIIALPMLVRKRPLPERRLIGDMSDGTKVIGSLELSNSGE